MMTGNVGVGGGSDPTDEELGGSLRYVWRSFTMITKAAGFAFCRLHIPRRDYANMFVFIDA